MNLDAKYTRYIILSMFAAILCVSAYISIPLPPTGYRLTLLNFVIALFALSLPWKDSFLVTLIWFLLGMAGVPVYVGGDAGIGYLLRPTGGFTIALLIISLLLPLCCFLSKRRIWTTIFAVLSLIFVDLFGTIYLMFGLHCSLNEAIIAGFLPFIVPDIIKAIVAAQISPAISRVFHRQRQI